MTFRPDLVPVVGLFRAAELRVVEAARLDDPVHLVDILIGEQAHETGTVLAELFSRAGYDCPSLFERQLAADSMHERESQQGGSRVGGYDGRVDIAQAADLEAGHASSRSFAPGSREVTRASPMSAA